MVRSVPSLAWSMKSERGQAIVEFALVLPLLLVVILGVVLGAEIGGARLALGPGAAEAARTGSPPEDDGRPGRAGAPARPPPHASQGTASVRPTHNEPP